MAGPKVGALLQSQRFRRFVWVGILGAGLDLAVAGTLLFSTDLPAEVAKVVGAECAIIVMFVVNDRWTFDGHRTAGVSEGLRRLLKSNLVRTGGIAVQVTIVYLLIRTNVSIPAWEIDLWPLMVMALAIVCGGAINYVGETLLTWGIRA